MRSIRTASLALLAATAFAGTALMSVPAHANVCQAGPLICATTMPVGGYCVCRSKGQMQDGTVIPRAPAQSKMNSTAGGCGAQPNAPGCR
jgi:hypothetical protein